MVHHVKQWRRAIAGITALPLLVLLWSAAPQSAQAKRRDYSFTLVSSLGDQAPGTPGGTFARDYEPATLNNNGDMLFGADLDIGGESAGEGIFVSRHDDIDLVARSFTQAPGTGGKNFEFGFLGPSALNNRGDGAFAFLLTPVAPNQPAGVNAALYRFAKHTPALEPIVIPNVTPAPESGGEEFVGVHFGPSLNDGGDLVFGGIVPSALGIRNIPNELDTGLGLGIYQHTASTGQISAVVIPGDTAPDGGRFDCVSGPWVNARGDIAFTAHVAGEECKASTFSPRRRSSAASAAFT